MFFALRTTLCERLAPVFIFLVHPSLTCSVLTASHGRQSADFELLRVQTATFKRNVSFPEGKPMILPLKQRESYLVADFLGGLLGRLGAPRTARFDVWGVHLV